MSRFDIEYVDSEDALSNACADLCRFGVIGIDTEFFRETTYYPIPALIQLYGEGKAYIVDCLAISHWEELAKLCRNQSVLKLLHSCGEDMEVFHRLIGTTPHPVVDTQLAAAIAGFDFSMGYQNLVKALFGEEVDKEQTRSNWLQRPLTEAQVRYAADDVVWLPKIWKALSGTLEEKGRLDWCLQDCEQLVQTPVPSLQSPDRAYLRLKAAWRLSGEDLHLLRAICAWRELEAQSRDVPRSRVLTDSAAIELSRRAPGSLAELRQIDQLKLNSRKGFADDVLMVIKKALDGEQQDWPRPLPDRSEAEFKRKMKQLRGLVELEARALELAPEVLGRKKELEKLLDTPELSEVMRGWRLEILGDKIAEIVSAA